MEVVVSIGGICRQVVGNTMATCSTAVLFDGSKTRAARLLDRPILPF